MYNHDLSHLMKRLSPAIALLLIAPTVGELISGSAPPPEFFHPFTVIIFIMLYGCGALLCRELVVRWGKGWTSLLLLGMAYGIFEEGIVVRSFFDPTWMDLGAMATYGRFLGVNWVWVEHLTHYHTLFSVIISVTIVELLYPDRRAERWISKRGLIACWICLGLMVPIGYLLTPYDSPDIWIVLTWASILGLGLIARSIPARLLPPKSVPTPGTRRFWWLAFVGFLTYFIGVYYMSESAILPFPVMMILLLILDGIALWLVLRWNGNGTSWDDRHRLAMVSGGLWVFIILSPLPGNSAQTGMLFVAIATAIALWFLGRLVKNRHLAKK